MNSAGTYTHADTVIEERRDLRAFLYLARFARPHRRRFFLGFSLMLGAGALVMVSARLLGLIVDSLHRDGAVVSGLIAALLACEAFALLCSWGGRWIVSSAALASVLEVRTKLFAHLRLLPLSYYDRTPQGRTVTRMTFDVEGLEEFFASSMGKLLNCFIVAGAALIAMALTYAPLAAWVALAVIPSIVMTLLTRDAAKRQNRDISKRNSAVNATLSEFLNGLPVIRMLGSEQWSISRYDQLVSAHQRAQVKLIEMYSWVRPAIGFLSMLPMLCLLWFGIHDVFTGVLTVGALVSFMRYFERFGRPMMELSFEIHIIQQAFTSAERVATFLREAEEDAELGINGSFAPARILGAISFDQVHMSYGKGVPALRGISFNCRPGEVIGLTGATGSGKSSTVALLARLYEFSHGSITIDGRDIREFSRQALRKQIGFVSQDVMIVKGTIRENLTFHAPVSDEEIMAACRRSGLYRVMQRNDLHLDSVLVEHGANLSVGERQLLSLTRIFVTDPAILILDEATANIDAELEQLIYEAMEQLSKSRTTLLIAHRLHTLLRCDRILAFQQGQIVEQGTHAELLAKGGYYAELWRTSDIQTA